MCAAGRRVAAISDGPQQAQGRDPTRVPSPGGGFPMGDRSVSVSGPPLVSRREKILYLTPNLKQGGAERQLLELIRRLPERFEPVICVFDRSLHYPDYLLPGEPRHVLEVGRMTRRGFRRLCEVLRAEQPAILHTWRDTANF